MKKLAVVLLLCLTTSLTGAIADEEDGQLAQLIQQVKHPDDAVRIKAAQAGRIS